jgi:DNA-binding NarL/FixJ family response regulator
LLKRQTRAVARTQRRIRVVIADDHRIFVEGVKALLASRGLVVVGVASDGDEAVHVATATRPDVILLDLKMPKLNGLDAARALLTRAPETAVVLLTGSDDLGFVLEAMTVGVKGFVVKSAASNELFDAINAASAGATYVSPSFDLAVKEALPTSRQVGTSKLTGRERTVLRLIAEGKTSKEIALDLRIALKTAETHRTRIMRKLDLHDIASLVRYAIRERIASA